MPVVNLKSQISRHPRSSYVVACGPDSKSVKEAIFQLHKYEICVFASISDFNHPTNDLWIFTYFSELWAQQGPAVSHDWDQMPLAGLWKPFPKHVQNEETSWAPPASDPTPWNLQENNTQRCLVVTVVKYIEGKSCFNKNLLQAAMESPWLLDQNEFFPHNHLPMSSRIQGEFIKEVGKLLKSI